MKWNSSKGAELIDFKEGNLKFADTTYKENHDLSWLDLKQEVERTQSFILQKEMSQAPPTKKRKEN